MEIKLSMHSQQQNEQKITTEKQRFVKAINQGLKEARDEQTVSLEYVKKVIDLDGASQRHIPEFD